MNIVWLDSTFCVADGKPLRVTGARGIRILCTEGCAWITSAGIPDDVFLHAGQQHQIEGDSLTLIEGVGTALVRLDRPGHASGLTGYWRKLRNATTKLRPEIAAAVNRIGRAASGRDFPV